MPDPTIGRIVLYKVRADAGYLVPAMITATVDTLHPGGPEAFRRSDGRSGVPPLSSSDHVHLTVFSPGVPVVGPNSIPLPDDPLPQESLPPGASSLNLAGCYQEWDVPFWEPVAQSLAQQAVPGAVPPPPGEQAPGTWIWPVVR